MPPSPFNIGVDVVDIADFQRRCKRTPALLERIFTERELKLAKEKPFLHLAGKLAAKEAFFKASRVKPIRWHDIEVTSQGSAPFIIQGVLKRASIDVSISHSKTIALAVVIIQR